jgi:hypothetical protein
MIYAQSFADELQKIAASSVRSKLFGLGRKLGLVETETDAAKRTIGKVMRSLPKATPAGSAVSAGAAPQAQLQRMKLQRQLEAMKRERGLL